MISVKHLHITAGSFVIRDVSFAIEANAYAVLMGKTGSGKTTILEAVCGLKPVRAGSIHLLEKDVTHLKPAERGVGYVPQDRALFSTMTVYKHLALALELRRWKKRDIVRRVEELADLLGIDRLLKRKPFGLSGGESQRVALGRALSYYPQILLLDEPLSALDEETKDEMCRLLKRIQEETGVTTLHVTHSLVEAHRLADRIFLIKDGQLLVVERGDLDGTPHKNGDLPASGNHTPPLSASEKRSS